jgi:hypothetical protein
MGAIMATGNYNFFNISYIAICIPLLVDSDCSRSGGLISAYFSVAITSKI